MTEFWYILYMIVVEIPVRSYVKDYLVGNFGPEPITLNEGNEYYWVLAREYPYSFKSLADDYQEKIKISLPNKLDIRNANIVNFSNFALQRIHHLVIYQMTSRPAGKKKDIILDVISEQNLDPAAFESLKCFHKRLVHKIKSNV